MLFVIPDKETMLLASPRVARIPCRWLFLLMLLSLEISDHAAVTALLLPVIKMPSWSNSGVIVFLSDPDGFPSMVFDDTLIRETTPFVPLPPLINTPRNGLPLTLLPVTVISCTKCPLPLPAEILIP